MIHDDCNCGCGDHDHDHDEMEIVTITVDGDTDLECSVIGVFETEEREYIALLPTDSEDVLIFRFSSADGSMSDMESDEEYASVSETFYELFLDDVDELDLLDEDDDDDEEDDDEDYEDEEE